MRFLTDKRKWLSSDMADLLANEAWHIPIVVMIMFVVLSRNPMKIKNYSSNIPESSFEI